MKLSELKDLEQETIDSLLTRSNGGDNEAARVLLEHLRNVSKDISQWQKEKRASEEK